MPVRVNVGCGPHYATGWINLDVVRLDDIQPDLLLESGEAPLPFDDNEVDQLYAGHVLEHIPWAQVPAALVEWERVLKPGGRLGLVGPDVMRTIERYAKGLEPLWLVEATLEDDKTFMHDESWAGARHQWNCYEARVLMLLADLGYTDVRALDMTNAADFVDWPTVARTEWQFGVEVRMP
jgi:SAM-dependent methyltransferase